MIYHNIYRSWAWTGGHADGERDLLAVALREAREESGLETLRVLKDGIFSLETLTVDGHIKRGKLCSQPSAPECNLSVWRQTPGHRFA